MAKKRKRRKRQNQVQPSKQPSMTKEKIAEVKSWLEKMQFHADKAVKLTDRVSQADMNESNDLFWALAKYTENVEESVVKLDCINNRIYPELIEIDGETWKGLKGMRSRLAHAFWNIDPQILWSTVTTDFPDLLALLSTIIVIKNPIGDNEPFEFTIQTDRLMGLPKVTPDSNVKAGSSIVVLVFGYNGRVGVNRIGHVGTKGLVFNSNFDTRYSVYGKRKQ